MNIASLNTSNSEQIRNITANKHDGPEQGINVSAGKANVNTDKVNLSTFGMVNNHIAGLSKGEQQEIKSYINDIKMQKANGTFDIKSSIDNAPDAVKQIANQLNLSTEDVLNMEANKGGHLDRDSKPGESSSAQLSAYTDVVKESNNQTKESSIFDVFSSWFSDDEKPVA